MRLGIDYADRVEAERCRALWRAVMAAAVADALEDPRERAWFRPGCRGFRLCCEMLDLDPRRVVVQAREAWVRAEIAEARAAEARAA